MRKPFKSLKCRSCKARFAPGEACNVHGGFYCDPDLDRVCPRCGAYIPPIAVGDFDVKGCEKCDRSSKLPMIERKRDEIERIMRKIQMRVD